MKRFNIVTRRTYVQNGEEKAQWNNVGTLVKFDEREDKPEGFALELHIHPDTKFYVFEQEQKERSSNVSLSKNVEKGTSDKIEYPEEEINPEDIPF